MESLNEDANMCLIDKLEVEDLYAFSCVSKYSLRLIGNSKCWAEKLEQDFDISKDILMNFPTNDLKRLFQKITQNFRYPQRLTFLNLLKSLTGTLNDRNTLSCILDNYEIFKENADIRNLVNCYLKLALFLGNQKTVDFFLEEFKLPLPNDSLQLASFSGDHFLIEYLLKKGFKWEEESLKNLVASKNSHTINQYIYPQLMYTYGMLEAEAGSGHLIMTQTLLNSPDLASKAPDALSFAARCGSEVLVDYLIEKYKFKPKITFLYDVITSNNFHFLKKILEKFTFKPDILALRSAIMLPQLTIFEFLFKVSSIKPKLDATILNCACEFGMLRNVRYLVENYNLEPDKNTLMKALSSNNAELVKYICKKFGLSENAKKSIEEKYPRIWNSLFFNQNHENILLFR